MKLIKPSFTIIEQQSGLEGIYKQIEMAGRTCYKSEDKITEWNDSIWMLLVDSATVHRDSSITFKFTNGNEITKQKANTAA